MKLLFDANLSHRLIGLLSDNFPGSKHVKDIGMESATDTEIWEYAEQNDFTIISKDSDFHQRSFLFGFPPKVIWVQKGNCSTREIAELIKKNKREIISFGTSSSSSFLILE